MLFSDIFIPLVFWVSRPFTFTATLATHRLIAMVAGPTPFLLMRHRYIVSHIGLRCPVQPFDRAGQGFIQLFSQSPAIKEQGLGASYAVDIVVGQFRLIACDTHVRKLPVALKQPHKALHVLDAVARDDDAVHLSSRWPAHSDAKFVVAGDVERGVRDGDVVAHFKTPLLWGSVAPLWFLDRRRLWFIQDFLKFSCQKLASAISS
jgi:hypothetical protein